MQNSLKDLADRLESKNFHDTPAILEKLQTELDKDMARRILAAKHGAYSTLLSLIKETRNDVVVLKAAIKTIAALMNGYPDLLDEKGISLQMELIKQILFSFLFTFFNYFYKIHSEFHRNNAKNIERNYSMFFFLQIQLFIVFYIQNWHKMLFYFL